MTQHLYRSPLTKSKNEHLKERKEKTYTFLNHAPKNKLYKWVIFIFSSLISYLFWIRVGGYMGVWKWKWSRSNKMILGGGGGNFSLTLDRRSIDFFFKSQRLVIYERWSLIPWNHIIVLIISCLVGWTYITLTGEGWDSHPIKKGNFNMTLKWIRWWGFYSVDVESVESPDRFH